MKNRLAFIPICLLFAATLFLIPGCGTTGQTIAYQTIGTTETLVYDANQGYLTSVVSGATPTNDVPKVEAVFNDTQLALRLAAVTASGGTNAPVPAAVKVKADNFITLANTSIKH